MYRVLIVPSFYPTQEAPLVGTFFRDHAQMLRGAGLGVDLVYVEVRSLRRFRFASLRASHFQSTLQLEQGVRVTRLHGWNPFAQTTPGGLAWAHLTANLAIRHAGLHGHPDLIHAHNALWGGEAARIISARLGVPFVVTEHSAAVLMKSLGRLGGAYARRVWQSARRVYAVSRSLADAIEDRGIAAVGVIGNPIDTDFFTLPGDGCPPPLDRHVLAVANLVPVKRIDHLLRSFRLAWSDDVCARLDVVGGGSEHAGLVALANALGLRERVRFLCGLDRSGVRDAMWRAACLVSSSRRETFGMAVAEALATGLPVVATRSGGVDEVLGRGIGTLVEPDDVEALAEALRAPHETDTDSRLRRRDHIRRLYAWDVVAAQYLSAYATVSNASLPRSDREPGG